MLVRLRLINRMSMKLDCDAEKSINKMYEALCVLVMKNGENVYFLIITRPSGTEFRRINEMIFPKRMSTKEIVIR